jgi:hypothetical protein
MTTYTITTINNGKIRTITTTGEDSMRRWVMDLTNKGNLVMEVRTESGRLVCL